MARCGYPAPGRRWVPPLLRVVGWRGRSGLPVTHVTPGRRTGHARVLLESVGQMVKCQLCAVWTGGGLPPAPDTPPGLGLSPLASWEEPKCRQQGPGSCVPWLLCEVGLWGNMWEDNGPGTG